MNVSNRTWVDEALQLLARGLKPFVQRHTPMTSAGADSTGDPSYLLRVIDERWEQIGGQFPTSDRGVIKKLVGTLREERHRWAHHQRIERHDVALVISGVVKLLEAVDAMETDKAKHLLREFNAAGNETAKADPSVAHEAMRSPRGSRGSRTGVPVPVHAWFVVDSPLGSVFVAHHGGRVSALRVAQDGDLACDPELGLSASKWGVMDPNGFVALLRDEIGVDVEVGPDPDRDPKLVKKVQAALEAGRSDVPIDLSSLASAPVHKDALLATTRIPRGEVRTYKDVARVIGRPNAYRPVSEAMRRNPVPLLVPCHRVVHETFRKTQDVGKWGYGSVMKTRLLAREGVL